MNYKFKQYNTVIEISNPKIDVISYSHILSSELLINVNIILTTSGGRLIKTLEDVKVNDLDFNESQLMERVLTRLNDFKI